jgi:hypothetical protein
MRGTELKAAIERMHGGTATLTQSVPVRETFDGKTVWEGVARLRSRWTSDRNPCLYLVLANRREH